MGAERRMRLWTRVVEHAHGGPVAVSDVCAEVISATGVDGTAVTATLSAAPRETLYASDQISADLEELMFTLGEGPGVDAVAGSPALVADITALEFMARWPVFAPAAAQAGVRAMFAMPMQVGAIRFGVMDLYRVHPGDLDREQLADALMLTDMACLLLLDSSHERARPDLAWPDSGQHSFEVHQATGMILVQLGVTAAVALVRLRAYAYAHDRRLGDVARDVVARQLRFVRDAGGADNG